MSVTDYTHDRPPAKPSWRGFPHTPVPPPPVSVQAGLRATRQLTPDGRDTFKAERDTLGVLRAVYPQPFAPDDPRAVTLCREIVSVIDMSLHDDDVESALRQWSGLAGWSDSLQEAADEKALRDFRRQYCTERRVDPGAIIRGLLMAGQTAIVSAPEKTAKTTIMADATAAIVTGTDYLGLTVPAPAAVLYLTAEQPARYVTALIHRGIDLRSSGDAALAARDRVYVSDDVSLLRKRSGRDKLSRILGASGGPRVVILDPLYLLGGDVSMTDLTAVGTRLRQLTRVITEAGATPVLVHHARKTTSIGEWPTLADTSGAGVAAFARSWLLLNRATPYTFNKIHDLLAITGTSQGESARLRVVLDERTMETTVTPDGEQAATKAKALGITPPVKQRGAR